jgi:hypothetical protein
MKIQNKKTKTITMIMSVLVIGLMLLAPTTVMPNAHAQTQKHVLISKWSAVHVKSQKSAMQRAYPSTIIQTISVYNNDCTHSATIDNPCTGQDQQTGGKFSYTTPFSYAEPGTCNYTCEDQDTEVIYPSQVFYNGNWYSFSAASQNQCTTNLSYCSDTVGWTSPNSYNYIDYYGTPEDRSIQLLTVVDYANGNNIVEYDYWYTLPNGYLA